MRYSKAGHNADIHMHEIRLAYERGVPLTAIAKRFDTTDEAIRKRLKALGLYERASARCKRFKYLVAPDRTGKLATIHRTCWEAHNGQIPDGHVIHHIDGNTTNNDISNLACMTKQEHRQTHADKDWFEEANRGDDD